jgi:hypothetical protein
MFDPARTRRKRHKFGALVLLALTGLLLGPRHLPALAPRQLDPAGWGSDHVGQPVPEFVTGDECLFCHRLDVGPAWKDNHHNRTVRDVDPESLALKALKSTPELKALADEVKLVMGEARRQRFLRPGEGYGKLDLLSVAWAPNEKGSEGKLLSLDQPHWDAKRFGDSCAGCHATGLDTQQQSFSARSLDCFACHGEVPAKHADGSEPAHLGRMGKDKNSARVVTSICAQCHIRTGKSRSTGRPFANNFVAGDNLFRDFQVDFSDEQLRQLNPADAHVLENVRAIAVQGKENVTCLSCHDVHKQSTRKHHSLAASDSCLFCHQATGSKKVRKLYEVHSLTCGY